jgi:hypothetical protein
MATISGTATINSIRLVEQGSAPSTPASGYSAIFAKSNGLYIVDDAGTVTGPFGAATIASDVLWDAKGDIAVGSGSNTAGRLAVGANGKVLTANSGATEGVEWATPKTVATDVVWAAKGDIAVATANDTASVLSVGANGYVLTADSGEATGVKWAAAAVGYTDEQAQDAAAALFTGGTHSGISFSYNDGSNVIDATVSVSGAISDTVIDAKGDLLAGTANDTIARLAVGTNGYVLTAASGETTGLKWAAPVRYITLGRYGVLTAAAGSDRVYVPFAATITNVYASVSTAPTGASLVLDVHKNGTTIFTTQGNRPSISAAAYTDTSSTPDVTSIAADDYLTLDVDSVGSTVAGADVRVILVVTTP